jgi:hypothetical protein
MTRATQSMSSSELVLSLLENQMAVLRTQDVGPDHYILAAMYQAAQDAAKLAKELWD